jgi:hypothetical protein
LNFLAFSSANLKTVSSVCNLLDFSHSREENQTESFDGGILKATQTQQNTNSFETKVNRGLWGGFVNDLRTFLMVEAELEQTSAPVFSY